MVKMVKHAFLKKLEDFPRLSNRENPKLRELGDIILDLECAKSEGTCISSWTCIFGHSWWIETHSGKTPIQLAGEMDN